VAGKQLLVGGDDRHAALEQLAEIAERRLHPAHELGDEPDRGGVTDVLEAIRQQSGRGSLARSRSIAHECSHDPHGTTRDALDDVGPLAQEAIDGRSDGSVSEQAAAERVAGPGGGWYVPSARFRATALRSALMLDASQGTGRHAVVVGCGRVGSGVTPPLHARGWDVAVIDERAETFQRLGEGFTGITVEGHALDTPTLVEAGIDRADAVVVATNGDNT